MPGMEMQAATEQRRSVDLHIYVPSVGQSPIKGRNVKTDSLLTM